MKPKHTPGPWEIAGSNGIQALIRPTKGADELAGMNDPAREAFAPLATVTLTGDAFSDANAARIVACVNACEGIADPSVVPDLLAALKELFGMIERKELVRDITHDALADWPLRMLEFIPRLQRAQDAIARAEGRKS